jgi:hypothetical protein
LGSPCDTILCQVTHGDAVCQTSALQQILDVSSLRAPDPIVIGVSSSASTSSRRRQVNPLA